MTAKQAHSVSRIVSLASLNLRELVVCRQGTNMEGLHQKWPMKNRERQVQWIRGFFCKKKKSSMQVLQQLTISTSSSKHRHEHSLWSTHSGWPILESTTNQVSSDLHKLLMPGAGCLMGRGTPGSLQQPAGVQVSHGACGALSENALFF